MLCNRVGLVIYFNPRAPCGARLLLPSERAAGLHFNPRAPCGARPAKVEKKQRTT